MSESEKERNTFLQQRTQLPYEHCRNVLEISDFLDFMGVHELEKIDPTAARIERKRIDEDLEKRRQQRDGWLPSDWLKFLSRVHYKPDWHAEILLHTDLGRYADVVIHVWACTQRPDYNSLGAPVETIAMQAMCYHHIRDDAQAELFINRILREMEDKILDAWFHVDEARS